MSKPAWLTANFIQSVLRNAKKDNSISVADILVKNATDKGENYASDLYRVFFNLIHNNRVKKSSVLVKTTHSTEGKHKAAIERANFFGVEMKMMTSTLREMESVLKDTRLGGLCYFAREKNHTVLVLEDLAPLGFKMANRHAGLDLQHSTLALQKLAKFHGSSVLISEKNPAIREIYSKGLFTKRYPKGVPNFYVNGLKSLVKVAASWPELREECKKKIEKLVDVAYEKSCDARKLDENEFNVINHGDFWVNNMLFKYDDRGNVIDDIFVDFQLCSYGTPALDLLYFLNSSVSEQVFRDHTNFLIEAYVKTLSETMVKIGCKTEVPSLEYIHKILADKAIIGFTITCASLPVWKLDKSKAQGLDEILTKPEHFRSVAYNNEAFRKVIIPRLHEWDSRGLFDKY